MTILSESEAKALLQKVLSHSKADECVANLWGEERGNIRYARNAVSTSGSLVSKSLSVESSFGKKSGVATISEFDDASLEKVVRRSEELARLAPENPEHVGVLAPQQYLKPNGFFDATAAITPAARAEAVSESLRLSAAQNLVSAGFLEDWRAYSAMMNSKHLFAYYPNTNVNFSLTVRTEDGTGSGYATQVSNDAGRLRAAAATGVAIRKSTGSVGARAIEPGKYTVILEPVAAVVLLESIFFGMDARSADEGRSFLSKPGGKTRLGEKLVDERVSFYSDPAHPDLPAAPWSGDGRAQEKTNWIEKGVVKNLYYSRYWAEKKGVPAVPQPNNMIMPGSDTTLEEMIRSTAKGILVTRLWYIRPVDPQTLLLTGLTRDGTFYIENGKIKHPVKNFRFNESPVIMLNNLEALGKPEPVVCPLSDLVYLIPPMKVRDFTFTSLSDAV